MIPNQWYAIHNAEALQGARPLALRRLGMGLVAWRDSSGRAHVMRDRCPHKGAKLSMGCVQGDRIECPYHGFQYGGDGACLLMPCAGRDASIPAAIRVDAFPAAEAHGLLWMFWGAAKGELPPMPWIDDVPEDARTSVAVPWPVNYARINERNLDVHHIPFVHPGLNKRLLEMGPRIDPYVVDVDGLTIRARGKARRDDGLSADSSPGRWFAITFKIPNVTFLDFTPDLSLQVLLIATPIDEAHSFVIARSYGEQASRALSERFATEAIPVVAALEPRHTGVGVSHLVGADEASGRYLVIRRQLLREVGEQERDKVKEEERSSKDGPPAPEPARRVPS